RRARRAVVGRHRRFLRPGVRPLRRTAHSCHQLEQRRRDHGADRRPTHVGDTERDDRDGAALAEAPEPGRVNRVTQYTYGLTRLLGHGHAFSEVVSVASPAVATGLTYTYTGSY